MRTVFLRAVIFALLTALLVIVLAPVCSKAQQDASNERTRKVANSPEYQLLESRRSLAEEREKTRMLADDVEKAAEALESADPKGAASLREKVAEVRQSLEEKPKVGAFRIDSKPRSQNDQVFIVEGATTTQESQDDRTVRRFPRSGFSGINTEWHLPSRLINLDRTCATTMTSKGVVHVRRAVGCNWVMSSGDKPPKQVRQGG
ncbi:MAG: hypothetical protein NUV80_02365 [Candidatus Berkelbacteria bacterium]|nr:hypothetical protein [Candidatus Berkelbacteria bacterium]